jgi:hypothetical protein
MTAFINSPSDDEASSFVDLSFPGPPQKHQIREKQDLLTFAHLLASAMCVRFDQIQTGKTSENKD